MVKENFEPIYVTSESEFTNFLEAFNDFSDKNGFIAITTPDNKEFYCKSEAQVFFAQQGDDSVTMEELSSKELRHVSESLSTPEVSAEFFARKGFSIETPLPIVNPSKTTIFTSAGVQKLDPILQNNEIPNYRRFFIAQPVLRSQFIGTENKYNSSTFINIATEQVNPTLEDHFQTLSDWLEYFEAIGLDTKRLILRAGSKERKWGKKRFTSFDVKVQYASKHISLGTALFIKDFPHEGAKVLSVSDIGFGLDRIRWIVSGGNYWEHYLSEKNAVDLDPAIYDSLKSLVILISQGVRPSNKDAGYRIRRLSKILVGKTVDVDFDLNKLLNEFYKEWSKWLQANVTIKEVSCILEKENERNLNKIALDELKQSHSDVGVDINLPRKEFLRALTSTSVTDQELEEIIKKFSL